MKDRKEEVQKELEELSPLLASLKARQKEEPPEAPHLYFEALPDRLMERLQEPGSEGSRSWWQTFWNWLERPLTPRLAVGLASAAMLLAAFLLLIPGSEQPDALAVDSLTADELSGYIESNLEEFEAELVIEVAEEYPDLSLLPETDSEISDDYLEELLQDLDAEELNDLL